MAYTASPVLIDQWIDRKSVSQNLLAVIGGSLLIGLCANAAIPIQPVPITLQTFGLFAIALALGARRATLAVVAYLFESTVLPFLAEGKTLFTPSSMGGVPVFMGPTAGYLLGFPLAVAVVGWLSDKGFTKSPWQTFLALAAGSACLYIPGLMWLSKFVGDKVLLFGLYPFIPGDIAKAIAASALFPLIWKVVPRQDRA